MPDTIVFIHGAWLASNSWERFASVLLRARVRDADPRVAAQGRRRRGAARAHSEELAGLGVQEIVDHYAAIIAELTEPPIIIGHSFGGLITQILLGRGHRPRGGRDRPGGAEGHQARAAVELAGGRAGARASVDGATASSTLDFEQFNYAFTNTWERGRRARGVRALRRARTRRGSSSRTGLANFTLHGADRGRLLPRGPRPAADHGRRARPHRPARGRQGELPQVPGRRGASPSSSSSRGARTC